MENKFKKIVLLDGLEGMEDYQFRTIKSLLRKELKLTKKAQDECDRIPMADLMEVKFPKDAGLDRRIELCQSIKDLGDLAKKLKTKKAKVQKQNIGKDKTVVKKRKQDEPSSSQSLPTNNESKEDGPSKEKEKETIKSESGKKRKLTQEQIQLPGPSETKDEVLPQSPSKPLPAQSCNSSNKKNERNTLIYYGIEDDTGTMEVVVYGRLTSVKCEPGNKLRLVCFELTSGEDKQQLRSVRHSYMQIGT